MNLSHHWRDTVKTATVMEVDSQTGEDPSTSDVQVESRVDRNNDDSVPSADSPNVVSSDEG